MKVRIREGNDFDVVWAIKRAGQPEDLSTATSMKLKLVVYGLVIEHNLFTVTDNLLSINIPKEVATTKGDYRLVFEYTLPDAGQPDGDLKCKTDVVPFRIVPFSADADDVYTVNTSSDVLLGFKGDKGEDGDDAYQIWLDLGNDGTYEDFIAYMRQPAVDAGASISELEGEIQVSEGLRVSAETARANAEATRLQSESERLAAEIIRQSNEGNRIENEDTRVQNEAERISKENVRLNSEVDRIEAEEVREQAESERAQAETARVNAEGERAQAETARVNAEGDATKGRVKAENDRVTAEGERAQAFEQMMGEADDKIEEMDTTLSTYDGRVTQVESDISQLAGDVNQMINDESARLEQESIDRTFKTMRIGSSGLVTLSPTTRYFTYRLNVMDNITLTIDLQRMIEQVGNARCRLIIDMPIVKTITITNPVLWGGTPPTFTTAGQYVLEVIDVDGSGTPLIWQVASTTKAEPTGNILFVDSTGADYSVGQINAGTPTRTTSSWASPFKYLQNAINAAQAGDIIFVKQGIYKPTHLRTTPTVYVDGDRLNRNATFTPKNGVDIYGGFIGTETKTWQRVMDADGYPVNKTILCGDIAGEATVDPAKTVGDTRTDASKANAAYNVVFGKAISALTYLNGLNIRYGNASQETGDQSSGGGIYSAALLIGINNTAYSNTATNGGGWAYGTNTNCTAYSNTATANGGGWFVGTNTNCTAYSNTAAAGGGWRDGTNTNCTAYSNTAAANGGGWIAGTNTNCIAYSNTATLGGAWMYGANTNCTGVNNKASIAVFGAPSTDTHINCLLYNNKTEVGVATGFDDKAASGVKIFRNNAYDVAHPTITGGAGSDINTTTCIANLTAEQAKIDVPTFIGAAATPEQLAELKAYAATITTKLKPKAGSVLKGAGVNNTTYPNPTDYDGTERPEASTIGILEGE